MYTRTYPPRGTPLPENYSGVALREETGEAVSSSEDTYEQAQNLDENAPVFENMTAPVCSEKENADEEEPASEPIPTDAEPVWQREKRGEEQEAPPRESSADTKKAQGDSDLLLIALAALLTEGDRRDDELLILLLLLLLS